MSTLSQNERQALNDIFTAITEKETFFSKLKENKSNIKHFLKIKQFIRFFNTFLINI